MLLLAFITGGRKVIKFSIDGKVIKYFDDIWKEGVQIMPKHQQTIEKFRRSGKYNLKIMAALIMDSNKGKSLKEYEKCLVQDKAKTEENLANMVRSDCKEKGLMEVK